MRKPAPKKFVCEKDYIWNRSTCTHGNRKYSESIFDDSVITCDETVKAVQSMPKKYMTRKFNSKAVTCKMDNFYVLLIFLSITIFLLIIVSIYCYYYHIKHRSKQKQILPYQHSNNKLKDISTTYIM